MAFVSSSGIVVHIHQNCVDSVNRSVYSWGWLTQGCWHTHTLTWQTQPAVLGLKGRSPGYHQGAASSPSCTRSNPEESSPQQSAPPPPIHGQCLYYHLETHYRDWTDNILVLPWLQASGGWKHVPPGFFFKYNYPGEMNIKAHIHIRVFTCYSPYGYLYFANFNLLFFS